MNWHFFPIILGVTAITNPKLRNTTLVTIGTGKHTFPSRTRSLSLKPPMVVPPRWGARVGYRQYYGPSFWKKRRAFSCPHSWQSVVYRPHKYQKQSCPKSVTPVLMRVSTQHSRKAAFFCGGGVPQRAKYVVTNRGGYQSAAPEFACDKIGSVIFSNPIHSSKGVSSTHKVMGL